LLSYIAEGVLLKVFFLIFTLCLSFFVSACGDSQRNAAEISSTALTSDALYGNWILVEHNDESLSGNETAELAIVSTLPSTCIVGKILADVQNDKVILLDNGLSQPGCFVSVLETSTHLALAQDLTNGLSYRFEGDFLVLENTDGETYRFSRLIP